MYLYGGRNQGALAQLARTLRLRHPGLQIVGGYAPPFRAAHGRRGGRTSPHDINRSGADVVWVGIGVPKQEKWMARMRDAARRAGADRRRRGVRLPRRPRPAGAALDAAARARVGCSGSRRSRAGCGSATLRYNPRFVAGFARQYLRHGRGR